MKSENIIRDKSYQFALKIIVLYRKLISEKEFIISRQLIRSGSSIGANVEEATAGVSKKDFAFKMSIASKEARETRYWLKLLRDSDLTYINIKEYLILVDELVRILTAIVKSSKNDK